MKERHAVFFGRGASCENPVLMKVNDRDNFRRVYREIHHPPVFPQPEAAIPVVEEQQTDTEVVDDIPF